MLPNTWQSGTLATAASFVSSLLFLSAGVTIRVEIREAVRRCTPVDSFQHDARRIVNNRLDWLEYFVLLALSVTLLNIFIAIASGLFRSKNGTHFYDNDVPPYWSKLLRATLAFIALHAATVAHAVATYGTLDYVVGMIDDCSSNFRSPLNTVGWTLWAALLVTLLSIAWGFLWALSSVTKFTLIAGIHPKG